MKFVCIESCFGSGSVIQCKRKLHRKKIYVLYWFEIKLSFCSVVSLSSYDLLLYQKPILKYSFSKNIMCYNI